MSCCFTSSKFYSNVTSSLGPSLTSLSPKLTIPISLGCCLFLIFCMCNYLHTTHFIHSVCIQLATWAEFKIVGFFFFFLISSLLIHKILSGSMGVAYCTPHEEEREEPSHPCRGHRNLDGGLTLLVCFLVPSCFWRWYATTILWHLCLQPWDCHPEWCFTPEPGLWHSTDVLRVLWSIWELLLSCYTRMYDLFIS